MRTKRSFYTAKAKHLRNCKSPLLTAREISNDLITDVYTPQDEFLFVLKRETFNWGQLFVGLDAQEKELFKFRKRFGRESFPSRAFCTLLTIPTLT